MKQKQEFRFYLKSPTLDDNIYSDSKKVAAEFQYLSQLDQETFWLLGLNNANKATLKDCIFKGTVDSSACDPRLIFKRLLQAGCTGFIAIHNHPSANCSPSVEDNLVTKQILKIAEIIGITFLDHIIIASDGHFSYTASGTMTHLSVEI